jgi:hypothetical protein
MNDLITPDVLTQLTQLHDKNADSLKCTPGTPCGIQKQNDVLEEKYLEAKNNYETAPLQLQNARRNFIIASQGSGAYIDERRQELTETAKNNADDMYDEFLQGKQFIDESIITLSESIDNKQNVKELRDNYWRENEMLKKKIANFTNDVSTSDRKTYYQDEYYDKLTYWNKLWDIIYYIFVLLLAVMFVLKENCYSTLIKICILSTVILYKNFIGLTNIWMFWVVTVGALGLLYYLFKIPEFCKEGFISFLWLMFAYYFPYLLKNVFLNLLVFIIDFIRMIIFYLPRNVYFKTE